MRSSTLIAKNLFHKKLRLALLLISIAMAFLLYGVLVSFQQSFSGASGAAESNRLIVANKINFTQPLPISYFSRVQALEGVEAATHSTWFGGYYREPRNFVVSLAVDFPTYFDVYPELEMPEAQLQSCRERRNALAVGRAIADRFDWQTEQMVSLHSNIHQQTDGSRSWEFVVCGIFTDSKENGADNAVYFSYPYFNESRSLNRDMIGLMTVTTAGIDSSSAVAEAIDSQFANSAAETETVTEQQFAAAFASQFGDIQLIITLVVGSAFMTILIIVGTTMAMIVRERAREIGIMKTLGFSGARIMRIVVGESMLIATVGGLGGLLLAQLIILGISQSPQMSGIRMSSSVWLTGLFWMALLGAITALIPVMQALRLNIVTALGRR